MKITNYNYKKYIKCNNYYNLENIYRFKKNADINCLDNEIEKILDKMYDLEGNDLIEKNNNNTQGYLDVKQRLQKYFFDRKSNNVVFDLKENFNIGISICECIFDVLIEDKNQVILIKINPLLAKTFINKIKNHHLNIIEYCNDYFHGISKFNSDKEEYISNDIINDLAYYKLVYEKSKLYNPYKIIKYFGLFLDEEKQDYIHVFDFTNILSVNLSYLYTNISRFFMDKSNKLNFDDVKCSIEKCKFENICKFKEQKSIENKEYINKEKLFLECQKIKYPIYYLDFETYISVYPRFKNEKLFSHHVFMYSLIVQESECSNLEYYNYIAPNNIEDYREKLFLSLSSQIGETGTVVVYNEQFEKSRLKEAIELFPHLAKKLINIEAKIYDLLYLLKGSKSNRKIDYTLCNYYNTKQKGSYSLKKVLPLFMDVGYSDLQISNGLEASEIYSRFHLMSDEELQEAKKELIEYCNRDVYGMYVILKKIKNLLD